MIKIIKSFKCGIPLLLILCFCESSKKISTQKELNTEPEIQVYILNPNRVSNSIIKEIDYIPLRKGLNKFQIDFEKCKVPNFIYIHLAIRNLSNRPILVFNNEASKCNIDDFEIKTFCINKHTKKIRNEFINLTAKVGREIENYTKVLPYKTNSSSCINKQWRNFEKSFKIPILCLNSETEQKNIVSLEISYLAPNSNYKKFEVQLELNFRIKNVKNTPAGAKTKINRK